MDTVSLTSPDLISWLVILFLINHGGVRVRHPASRSEQPDLLLHHHQYVVIVSNINIITITVCGWLVRMRAILSMATP